MKIKLLFLLLFISGFCIAQVNTTDYRRNLSKGVSLTVRQERVSNVLQMIGKAGGFYFSYNGVLFRQDSLVNLNVKNIPVREVLDQLFDGKVDYKENGEYIILRYAVNHLTIEAEHIGSGDNEYAISGYVTDTRTGNKIKQASVYEKRLLQAALTDNNGYFTLRFRGEHSGVILTASKESYRDTSLVFLADINIKPGKYEDPDQERGAFFSNTFGGKGFWRFLVSSKQRIQNLNIPDFFAQTPIQASFTPGLSSHGSMSSSVINKVSLNVIGGYTAGTNGFEIAGVFNLTKGDIRKIQMAGLFNVVGGSVKGTQLSGAYNDINLNVDGFQVAGLLNRVEGKVRGIQMAGVGNIAGKELKGAQVAGLINMSKNTSGVQLAGVLNKSSGHLKGVQISGLVNYAKKMDGFQFGVVNLADSSSGVSIGLINLSNHGYRKISVYTNEVVNTNIAFKSGNANLYTLLIVGKNFSGTAQVLTYGLGLGHDFILNKRFAIAAEGTIQSIYLGNFEEANNLYRLQTLLQVNALPRLAFFAGPAYNYYVKGSSDIPSGDKYKKELAPKQHHDFSNGAQGWLGWNLGVAVSL
ncbi:STN and carboxypeptidase regulatory-like domain-containing protein [Pedobacter miscanthi]|uniref:STN and carboxypeptidase regulatory-like domain-containing protein n=1 Tax=Pedobacter miscanthi TaxID=2259170 RepID=UPI0029307A0D|nr:STN and carboxypeptidase regulatory-like domain-containing protein [Pedobacter miscanthi]